MPPSLEAFPLAHDDLPARAWAPRPLDILTGAPLAQATTVEILKRQSGVNSPAVFALLWAEAINASDNNAVSVDMALAATGERLAADIIRRRQEVEPE
jgi:hypothetical protein